MNALTFDEVKNAIKADGDKVTYMVQGEVGIGKTSVGQALAAELGYHFAFMDMANMSLGDLTMPVVDRDMRCVNYFPNEVLKLHTGDPVVVMMDEWTKAGREVKNMTLPLALERRLGSIRLHPKSIVFATGNMAGNGVGDSIQAHQVNRFIAIEQAKPDAATWISKYGIDAGIDPVVLSFVDQFPMVLQSYKDDPEGANPYIFNPKKQGGAFVSPRSLKFASDILKTKAQKTTEALHAGLAGALGAAAAAEMVSYVHMDEQLPKFEDIVGDPTRTPTPENPVVRLLLTFTLVLRTTKETLPAVLLYLERFNNEMQGIFLNKMLSTPSIAKWAAFVPEMSAACQRLHHVF